MRRGGGGGRGRGGRGRGRRGRPGGGRYDNEYDEYDEDDLPELVSEADEKRKESASKGLSLLEEVMSEGKLDEGKYLELCNVFRDIHQN